MIDDRSRALVTEQALVGNPKPVFSPTQADMFESCQRKWGWRYLEKIPTEPNVYAERGLAVHKVLEDFLRDGTPPDRETEAGRIAIPGLKYLPPPGTGTVEGSFLWRLPDESFDLRGIIDFRDELSDEEKAGSVVEALQGIVPRIIDHKTTGNFQWAKTRHELETKNVQSIVYAAYVMHVTGSDKVLGRWVYYRTSGRPAAMAVDWGTDKNKIAAPLESVLATCREMARIKHEGLRAAELAFDVGACNAYGGCPFRSNCNLSAKERFRSFMTQQSLKDKMKARKAAKEEPGQAEIPAINPPEQAQQQAPLSAAPAEAPAQGQLSLKDKMRARQAPPEQAPAKEQAQPAQPPAAKPPANQGKMSMKEKMQAKAAAKAADQKMAKPSNVDAEAEQQRIQEGAGAVPEEMGAVGFDLLLVDCSVLKVDREVSMMILPLSNLLQAANGSDLGQWLDANPLPANHGVSMSLHTPDGKRWFDTLSARATNVFRGM